MNIQHAIKNKFTEAFHQIYSHDINANEILIQNTRKEFKGDFTINVFPYLKITKLSPEQTANVLGEYLKANITEISGFNIIKGFLNIELSESYWLSFINTYNLKADLASTNQNEKDSIVIEYSSPNTNKPLHLGHIRNNLLGYSLANIIKASGKNVIKVNLINDRGIHICKSMIAWIKWGNVETPESSGIKGDHLVGKYYVKFNDELKKEIELLMQQGLSEEEVKKKSSLLVQAQDFLQRWEEGEEPIVDLWRTMNGWVYNGFDITYKQLGIDFDKTYYESDTYKYGKAIVLEGLNKGVFYKKDDGSVWADLTNEGLDEKLLLRPDGTSVYMTQDLGTAKQRFDDFNISKHIYVVGNEQNYHFDVLKKVLKKLGYDWADKLYHLSYGMVELPEGKMKSREGTVVDADDLIEEMISLANETSKELGKLDGLSDEEINKINRTTGLGALKYFILKVDPKKNMVFNPKESIDFNGNTGVFIQYSYARIQSLIAKGKENNIIFDEKNNLKSSSINIKEIQLIKILHDFKNILNEAADTYSPALIANYTYELAKEYNQFYHEFPIIKLEDIELAKFRLLLSHNVGEVIKFAMSLLGIDVPERM